MQTVTEWFRGVEGWRQERCFSCHGTGMVSSYSWADFEGPAECDMCHGSGAYWRTPKGRYVVYPGGPFI
jgi:DnaJ-class molecular chaperone